MATSNSYFASRLEIALSVGENWSESRKFEYTLCSHQQRSCGAYVKCVYVRVTFCLFLYLSLLTLSASLTYSYTSFTGTAVKLSAWECRTIETFVLRSGGDPLSRVETRDNDNMKLWRRRDWSDSSKDMYAFGLLMWSVLAWKSLDSSVMSKFNSKRSSTTNDDIDGALDSPIAMSPGHRPRFDVEKGLRILKSEADEEDVQKAAVLIHNCLLKDSAKSLSFAKISKELENILSRKDGEDVLSVI